MKNGIYAVAKEREDKHVDVDFLYSTNNRLFNVKQGADKSLVERVTTKLRSLHVDTSKCVFTEINGKVYLTAVKDVQSRREFIELLGNLARACMNTKTELYVFSNDEIIYTTDKAISLVRTKPQGMFDLGSANKAAMQAIFRSEVKKFR